MASPAPLTTQTISDGINIKYTQATDTPLVTDDDGKLRINLINEGIDRWQFFNNVRWRELLVLNFQGPTIQTNTVTYSIDASDFRELSSRLRLLCTDGSYKYVEIYSPQRYQRYMDSKGNVETDDNGLVCCISGNPSAGYQINLGWVPGALSGDVTVGAVAYFDYYKFADKMVSMTDVPEMQNPQFLVSYVTGELFVDDDVNLWTKFNTDAMNVLGDMSTDNDEMPDYESNAIEDNGEWARGGGFRFGV
jgi:hypothetical protein